MSSSTGPDLSVGNRFATITDDDHTGTIWVVTILCIIYTVMVLVLRVATTIRKLGVDDYLAIAATVFAIPQYALVFAATARGLGRSYTQVTPQDAAAIGRFDLASNVLALIAMGLAKISVVLLCRRIFGPSMKSHIVLCDVAVGIAALWTVGSVLAVLVGCDALQSIGYSGNFCSGLVLRWKVIGVINCMTELALVLLGGFVVWPLQMSATLKMQVLAAFVLRLILIVFVVLHVHFLSTATTGANHGVALAAPTIYLELELLYALTSCAVPALNRWLRNFNTSMGGTWVHTTALYGSNRATERSAGQTYQLHSIGKSQTRDEPEPEYNAGVRNARFTPNNTQYTATVGKQSPKYARSIRSQEHHSSGSMNSEEMIIRKDIQWQVQYEERGDSA